MTRRPRLNTGHAAARVRETLTMCVLRVLKLSPHSVDTLVAHLMKDDWFKNKLNSVLFGHTRMSSVMPKDIRVFINSSDIIKEMLTHSVVAPSVAPVASRTAKREARYAAKRAAKRAAVRVAARAASAATHAGPSTVAEQDLMTLFAEVVAAPEPLPSYEQAVAEDPPPPYHV